MSHIKDVKQTKYYLKVRIPKIIIKIIIITNINKWDTKYVTRYIKMNLIFYTENIHKYNWGQSAWTEVRDCHPKMHCTPTRFILIKIFSNDLHFHMYSNWAFAWNTCHLTSYAFPQGTITRVENCVHRVSRGVKCFRNFTQHMLWTTWKQMVNMKSNIFQSISCILRTLYSGVSASGKVYGDPPLVLV